jgi:ribA/ribD-fused uncharacterized protein
MKKDIAGFFIGGWYVFDNFAPFQIEWRGKLYPTSEHAFQAAHFFDTKPEIAEKVRLCRSPREASDYANSNKQYDDPNWKQKRVAIMEELVRCKIEQHPFVKESLVGSGDKYIVEMNDNDEFWGWGKNHDGQNMLGTIWMKVRQELMAGRSL